MDERDDRTSWEERDDWFAEPEPEQRHRPEAPEEIWLDHAAETPAAGRGREVPRRWLVIGSAGLVVVLLLSFWAAGVFGGGSTPRTAPPTTTRPATTTVRTPARNAIRPPATTLAPGARGVQVERLQRALARLGYSPGRIDGSYGPATVAALKRFQRATGLQPDGVLGPKTLQAVKAKL